MVSERYLEEVNLIQEDELLEHVSLAVLRSSAAGIPAIVGWPKGTVTKSLSRSLM